VVRLKSSKQITVAFLSDYVKNSWTLLESAVSSLGYIGIVRHSPSQHTLLINADSCPYCRQQSQLLLHVTVSQRFQSPSAIDRIQSVLNDPARLVFYARSSRHINALLCDLHLLLICRADPVPPLCFGHPTAQRAVAESMSVGRLKSRACTHCFDKMNFRDRTLVNHMSTVRVQGGRFTYTHEHGPASRAVFTRIHSYLFTTCKICKSRL